MWYHTRNLLRERLLDVVELARRVPNKVMDVLFGEMEYFVDYDPERLKPNPYDPNSI